MFFIPLLAICTVPFITLLGLCNIFNNTSMLVGASIILSAVSLIGYIIYCGKQEKFHAVCGMFAQKFQRPPTEEEKKKIKKMIKERKTFE